MALVQYYVMKRPKHPITGEIVRGKSSGATQNADLSINPGATLWYAKNEATVQANGSLMSITAPMTEAERGQVDGEPWILHSVHFSPEDAKESAVKAISTVGSENVRVLQVLSHEMILTLGTN